eukprot:TRINITY_DN3785_c0_g1_i3.p1 TRINITY_DN3785_c0_g1~~TRINITY_DN3785_c0_g1_i3.p1  ORF type:complete len:236 (+),score=54.73 TRINITY_DN3785_c0_g1_i3:50-757(+)
MGATNTEPANTASYRTLTSREEPRRASCLQRFVTRLSLLLMLVDFVLVAWSAALYSLHRGHDALGTLYYYTVAFTPVLLFLHLWPTLILYRFHRKDLSLHDKANVATGGVGVAFFFLLFLSTAACAAFFGTFIAMVSPNLISCEPWSSDTPHHVHPPHRNDTSSSSSSSSSSNSCDALFFFGSELIQSLHNAPAGMVMYILLIARLGTPLAVFVLFILTCACKGMVRFARWLFID